MRKNGADTAVSCERMCAPVPLVEGLDLTSLFAGRMYNTVSSAKV
jgi:hypothetical protein